MIPFCTHPTCYPAQHCWENSYNKNSFYPGGKKKETRIFQASRIIPGELSCGHTLRFQRAFRGTKFTAPPRVSTQKRILLSGVLKRYVFLHNWKLEIIIVAPSGTAAARYNPALAYGKLLRSRLRRDLFGK